jgi:pimeloyl-ACP methyl ester carboxylesterase
MRTLLRRACGPLLLLGAAAAWGEPTQITHGGLRLNGELQTAGSSPRDGKPIFLIVHGTWAHHGMEIIQALQSILAEYGYPSLAITLSLGLDDRRAPLSCDAPVLARHDGAVAELAAWLEHLKGDGWPSVILAGHSRGGAQAALFQQRNPNPSVQRLLLIAPLVWRPEAVADEYDARSTTALKDLLAAARDAAERGNAEPMGPHPLLYCDSVRAIPDSFLSYYDTTVPKHTPTLLGGLGVPVDVYLGTEDDLARWRPDDLALAEGRPGITLHDVDGADHFFRDLYLYDVVEDFLGRLP